MADTAERYRTVAAGFTARAKEVPPDAWDNPAPCAGWVARDIVRHMVEWMPDLLFTNWNLDRPVGPATDDDPVGAWLALNDAIEAALADPDIAGRERDIQPGRFSFEVAVGMFAIGDILVHTWDLARATGLDETLDAAEVQTMFAGMEPYDEMLRASGHYGPRVDVPPDADVQTRLIAFTGRHP